MKPISRAVAYISIIPVIQECARRCGYSIGVHGSLERDLDLIAVPWIEEAESAEQLVMHILSTLYGATLPMSSCNSEGVNNRRDQSVKKPHGRIGWSIMLDNGCYIDLSIMPRVTK